MRIEDFRPKMIVTGKDGKRGVVVNNLPGMMNCNGPDEVSVVWEGTTIASGTDYRTIKVVGKEEAVVDLERCGAGQRADCCIFLSVGENGPDCERFGDLRWDRIFRTNNIAKRHPTEPFPACQLKV